MEHLGSELTTTTKRRRGVLGFAIGAAALATALIPASAADAGRPAPGSPKKPVVTVEAADMAVEIMGEADMSNVCGPGTLYCHTYLAIMIKVGRHYEVHKWVDISGLSGWQQIFDRPEAGWNKYRTAVHDFAVVATHGECGPKSKWIGGRKYMRWSCDGHLTTYLRIYSSGTRMIKGLTGS